MLHFKDFYRYDIRINRMSDPGTGGGVGGSGADPDGRGNDDDNGNDMGGGGRDDYGSFSGIDTSSLGETFAGMFGNVSDYGSFSGVDTGLADALGRIGSVADKFGISEDDVLSAQISNVFDAIQNVPSFDWKNVAKAALSVGLSTQNPTAGIIAGIGKAALQGLSIAEAKVAVSSAMSALGISKEEAEQEFDSAMQTPEARQAVADSLDNRSSGPLSNLTRLFASGDTSDWEQYVDTGYDNLTDGIVLGQSEDGFVRNTTQDNNTTYSGADMSGDLYQKVTQNKAVDSDLEAIWQDYLDNFYGGKKTDYDTRKSDYQRGLDNIDVGETINWAGGTLTKNTDGTVTYKDSSGKTTSLDKNTDLYLLTSQNPEIKKLWDEKYTEEIPGYKDRLQTNNDYYSEIGKEYVDSLMSAITDFSNTSRNSVNDYEKQLESAASRYLSPTLNFKLAGQNLNITPKRNISIYDNLTDNYRNLNDARTTTEKDILTNLMAGLTSGYAVNKENSPERTYFDYMNKLSSDAWSGQNLRYGLPTTTNTADIPDQKQSTLSQINDALKIANGASDIWDSIGGDKIIDIVSNWFG